MNRTVLGAAVLTVLSGTAFGQISNRAGPPMRTGSFSNMAVTPAPSPVAPMGAAAAARFAPARISGPAMPAPAAAAAAVQRRGTFNYGTPVVSAQTSGGAAALPGRQNIMPRNTGAGLAPTQVVVPEYTVLPPGWRSAYDTPLPPRVEPRNTTGTSPLLEGSGFAGPVQGGGSSANVAYRQGSFASASFGPSGFNANAVVHDNNFSLAAHVGAGAEAWCRPWWSSCSWYEPCRPSYAGWCGGYSPYWGWNSWPGYYYPSYSYVLPVTSTSAIMYQDPTLSPSYSPSLAQSQQGQNAPVLTDFQRASVLMLDRRFAEAATGFRAAIKLDPGDAPARRWLGISLLLLGRTQDGAAEISRAYATDPDLADTSPDLEAMGLTVRQLSDLCAPVITYAKRVNSPAGYVTAAMLMQVRSRPDLAAKMLDCARQAGMDGTVIVRLNQAMTR